MLLTTFPTVSEARTKDGSATALAQVEPILAEPMQDCIDINFTAVISYTAKRPLVDLWGLGTAEAIAVDHGALSVAARPECVDALDSVEATVYLYAPVCEGGRCEGAFLDHSTGQGDGATSSHSSFEGPRSLPSPGLVGSPWCLEFDALVAYGKLNGPAASDTAKVTATDLCLDLS